MQRIIYSLRVMTRLVEMGNIPVAMMDNPRFEGFKCWIFKVDDKFQRDLDEILGDR